MPSTIANYDDSMSNEASNEAREDDSDAEDFVSINRKETSITDYGNPYGFAAALTTDLSALPRNTSGYLDITDCILAYVNNEFPIHYELLCQHLAPLYGNEKATIKVRREVDYGINRLHGKIIRKGDFLFPKGWEKITVRVPNSRKINHISIEELAEAMNTMVEDTLGFAFSNRRETKVCPQLFCVG